VQTAVPSFHANTVAFEIQLKATKKVNHAPLFYTSLFRKTGELEMLEF
jgi:hypothetical protein